MYSLIHTSDDRTHHVCYTAGYVGITVVIQYNGVAVHAPEAQKMFAKN